MVGRSDALRFASVLAEECRDALGDALDAVILHGSLTLGGYVAGRSNIDLLVIVARPLTDAQVAALADLQAPTRVDLRVVTRQVAAEPTRLPALEAGISFPCDREPRTERRTIERDLVVELSVCRAHGVTLQGLAPRDAIGEVPDAWVLDVADAQLSAWQAIGDDPPHAQLTVLTACRVWRFAEEGRHCSKAAAGEWALQRDPTLRAVRDALRQRHDDPGTVTDAAEVARLLTVVRGRISRGGRSVLPSPRPPSPLGR
jgi:hypothetical protein